MEEPSVITEAFKTGRAAKPPSPMMSIPTLEMTVRMFGETVPEATEEVDVEVTVTDEHGTETTKTERKTVDLSEEKYRAALSKLIPPDSLSALVKSAIKDYQKEKEPRRRRPARERPRSLWAKK